MALPAFHAWRQRHPDPVVTVLAKPRVADFWALCAGVDTVTVLKPGLSGTHRAAATLKGAGCDMALLLPNAFRSAWIAWRAGIPKRRGFATQGRGALLTRKVERRGLTERHQVCENYRLFGLECPPAPPAPRLTLPGWACEKARQIMGNMGSFRPVALLPGAARGPSKRWPAASFVSAAKHLAQRVPEVRFLVCGTSSEALECGAVCKGLGGLAVNLCGRTPLPELAALLAQCHAVCCNDSGGMHLATATGTPVVAIFGLTDPAKTGPLGADHHVIAPENVTPSRAVARRSKAAVEALASIEPERVVAALLETLRP